MSLESQDRKDAVLARMARMGFSDEELGVAREILEETRNFSKPWKTRFLPTDLFDFLGYAVWCVIGYQLVLNVWDGLFNEQVWKNVLAVAAIPIFAYATFSVLENKKTESINISDLGSGWKKARIAITACAVLRQMDVGGTIGRMTIIDNVPRRSST